MALKAVVGSTSSIEPREAGSSTARKVVDQPGQGEGVLGILFVSADLAFSQVLNSAATLLGDIPIIGCSVAAGITEQGVQDHGAQLALLTGDGVSLAVDWQPEFDEDSATAARNLLTTLGFDGTGALFICADGYGRDANIPVEILPEGNFSLAGALAASDHRQPRTFQVAGRRSGFGGIAGALMHGNLSMAAGQAHGWMPIGAHFTLTGTSGPFILEMDGLTPADAYARLFGFSPEAWTMPPLDQLARMYPLGLESGSDQALLLRSPLRMELNGLLRMHAPLPQGQVAHLMVGSVESCLAAVEKAAQAALERLQGARPVLGLVLVDLAWRYILQSLAGAELQAVRRLLKTDGGVPEIPLMGAYVYGQFGKGEDDIPEMYNQHVQVVLFGTRE